MVGVGCMYREINKTTHIIGNQVQYHAFLKTLNTNVKSKRRV